MNKRKVKKNFKKSIVKMEREFDMYNWQAKDFIRYLYRIANDMNEFGKKSWKEEWGIK